MGTPLLPTARGCANLDGYFAKLENIDFEVFAARADIGSISEVTKVPGAMQDRRKIGWAIWEMRFPNREKFVRGIARMRPSCFAKK